VVSHLQGLGTCPLVRVYASLVRKGHHPDVTVMCELFQGRASITFLIQVIVHRIAGSVVQGLQIERMQGLENRCKRMGT
jgi:hypothetical protein